MPGRLLPAVSAVSGAYDVALGLTLLLARGPLAAALNLPAPTPPIHVDLNGLFLLAIGVGYVLPFRRPDTWRAYLWIMGPFLKGAGAVAFIVDHYVRHSPDAFLLFALTDGTLAAVTWWALAREGRD